MIDFGGIATQGTAWATGVLGAVVAAGFAVQKVRKAWASDGAETDVVTLLREEVNRLAEQNKRLAENITRLHEENSKLRDELVELRLEIKRLRGGGESELELDI